MFGFIMLIAAIIAGITFSIVLNEIADKALLDQISVLDKIRKHADKNISESIDMMSEFEKVSYYKHLFYLMTFRNPYKLYSFLDENGSIKE